MKKLLALGLSLAMMASLSAVAFAEEIVKPATTGDTVVKTVADLPDEPDVPGGDETWTVTIPASIDVPWDNENGGTGEGTYTLDATLAAGSKVTVSVDQTEVTMTTPGSDDTLTAAIGGDTSNFTETSANDPEGTVTATVTAEQFNAVTVGEYTGTLSFTVVYENSVV